VKKIKDEYLYDANKANDKKNIMVMLRTKEKAIAAATSEIFTAEDLEESPEQLRESAEFMEDFISTAENQMKIYKRTNKGTISVNFYPTINEFSSIKNYETYIDIIIESVKKHLSDSNQGLRKMNIAYKFNSDEELRKMNLVLFLFNIIMWYPYIYFRIPITETDIFQPETFYNNKYMDYYNSFSERYRDKFTMAEFSESLFNVQIFMNKVAVEIGPLFGNSISIYDMVKMAKRNAEIAAILNTKVNLENFKVREVEEFLISQTERMLQILLSEDDKNNPLKPFIRARTGVNRHQVSESFVHLGFKPDLDGNTIPITANTNLMSDGLNNPEAIFTDAKGGRKAAILQQKVSEAGYFARHSTFATNDITLNDDPTYSCDTVNLVSIHVENQKQLEALEGRFRKIEDKKYKIITKKDTELIGTKIDIRSPITCAHKENKICKVCYGTLYNVNYGMHAGLFAAIDSNENKTQIGLSAKHVLDTTSDRTEIIDEKMFLVNQNGWLFNLNKNINKDKYELIFNHPDVMIEDPNNYDKYDNYFIDKLVFRNKDTKETFDVYESSNIHLYLSKQLFIALTERKFFSSKINDVIIPLSEFSSNEPFVFLRISNEELTRHIKELTNFIQKGKKPLKEINDYNEYVDKLNKLFRQGRMNIPSVHIEMIIRNLIRNSSNDLEIPNWSIKQTPDMYRLVSLNESILLKNSVVIGLMFEQVKKQLRGTKIYKKKGSSIYSLMFVNE